jgi:predicted ATPase
VAEFIDLLSGTDRHLHHSVESCPQCIQQLEKAADLYRGEFLRGFNLGESPVFSEWALLMRESLHRRNLQALYHIADYHLRHGRHDRATSPIRRQLKLEPWREEAHRQLMENLARNGDRGAALAQYEICRQVLADELGVEPSAETIALYRRIRDGTLISEQDREPGSEDAGSPLALPPFLTSQQSSLSPPARFVGRKRELVQLGGFLNLALAGRGRAVFVTGEAGSGKTSLVQEFARRAQETQSDLVVAEGGCHAYTGIGDPYLPFREIFALHTGEVESKWAAGAIGRESAIGLWSLMPLTIEALINAAPELVDTFVAGKALVGRARGNQATGASLMNRLEETVARREAIREGQGLEQSRIFEAYAAVLERLARQRPLLLILDDLHWADRSSIGLLFHLGRRMKESRLLIVGTYRPEDLAQRIDDEQRILPDIVGEFGRLFGHIRVDLDHERAAKGRGFVDELLDSEPNQLSERFRQRLVERTQGHALFTVELLRDMRERGDLVQDELGRWNEGAELDWDSLPARVEGVIAKRIGRLEPALQETLKVASVEGENFTAEVVSRVQQNDVAKIVRRLSSELGQQHRLVSVEGVTWVGRRRLSRYRFRHNLFQKYLYNSLDEVERSHIHEAVGNGLETLYGNHSDEVSGILARHFQAAGIPDRAINHRLQAGNRAIRLSAYDEAIGHLKQGLELAGFLPEGPDRRARQELRLQIALGTALIPVKGYAAPEVGATFKRARMLGKQVGKTQQQFAVLWGLWHYYTSLADLSKGRELAEQLLSVAEQSQSNVLLPLAHRALSNTLTWLGELTLARKHAEQGVTLYDRRLHRDYILLGGEDPGVNCRSYGSWIIWLLGYPDQALHWSREALALAEKVSHPLSVAYALNMITVVHLSRRNGQAAHERAEAQLAHAAEHGFAVWSAFARFLQGWAQAEHGEVEAGIEQMHEGLIAHRAAWSEFALPYCLAALAEMYGKVGQPAKGLTLLVEAREAVVKSGERVWDAEILRLTGEMLLMQDNDESQARGHFQEAIEVARGQSAKSLELRAKISLSRLLQMQGNREAARRMMAEIYNWFTEGFETQDLVEAKALLKALS